MNKLKQFQYSIASLVIGFMFRFNSPSSIILL